MSKKQEAKTIPGLTGKFKKEAGALIDFLKPQAFDPVGGSAFGPGGFGSVDLIRNRLNLPGGTTPSQAAGSEAALSALGQFSDLFGSAAGQRASTIAGENLNFLDTPTGRSLTESLTRQGGEQFERLLDRINQRAAAGGNLRSSARTRAIAEAGEDVTENVTDALTRAAAGQFGAERAAQEQAASGSLAALPQLAQLLFQQGGQQRQQERGEAVQEVQLAEALRRAPISDIINVIQSSRTAGGGITQGRDPLALAAGLAGSIFGGAGGLPF